MECHKCPHREDVEAGKYRGMAFEKTPCGACELRESSVGVMPFDDGRPGWQIGGGGAAPVSRDADGAGVGQSEECLPVSVLRELAALLLTLPPRVRDAVCWRYVGMMYGEIALIEGVSAAAVEMRVRRALRKWPQLQPLFRVKLAKQKRRRVSRRSRRRDRRKIEGGAA